MRTAKNPEAHYRKMTETSVGPLVLRMAVPTIISMLITNIYNLVDTAFVGQLGTSASGAVGIVFGFMGIIQAIGFTFGQGAGSIASRKLGAGQPEEGSRYLSTAFLLAFVISVMVEILCFIWLDPLVKILGSTPTIAPYAKTYITYILLASPFTVGSFVLNNVLRFEGKAMYGMFGLCTGAVLNMIGDPILMFGFKMGIAGAGLSTAISQTIGFFVLLSAFWRKRSAYELSLRHVRMHLPSIGDIIGTGMPSLLRQGLTSFTTMLLNTEAAVYGDAAVAAMSITARVSFFVFSFVIGIGQGFQPVAAFNYGAKKYTRVRKGYRVTMLYMQILVLCAGMAVLLGSDGVIGLFRDDPEVVAIGTPALRLQMLGLFTMPFCTATEMCMQSTGQKLQASILSAMRAGIIFIPLLIILARLRGLDGIREAQPLSFALTSIPAAFLATWFFGKMPKTDG